MTRTPLSKKMRFDVFKRDLFACQYCGATPPGAVLEVDHIHPVSQGGKNSIGNLVTACFGCNRGKGAGLLTSLPESIAERAAIVAEKMAQIKAYERLLKAQRKHAEASVDQVEEAFQCYFPSRGFSDAFRQSVRVFLKSLDAFELADYMHKACAKRPGNAFESTKYFCGICWNVIKERKNG